MRLSLWLFVCLIYLQFPTYSFGNGNTQADKKVTLSGILTLHAIFQKIEEQTGKRIYYTNSILNDEEKVTINIVDGSIQQTLSQILSNKNLEWSIEEKFISIRKSKSRLEPSSFFPSDSIISISGKITNERGEPIAGATVLVKNSNKGITTTPDGLFRLENINANSYLVISSIGYLSQEIHAKGKLSIGNIRLQEYIGTLDETQVIAYGTTSKRLSTSNISTIKAEDIAKAPVGNPLLAISARVPGVFIQQSMGVPGSGVKIIIQGQNSLNYGNDPFYVIDGVPYTSQLLPSSNTQLGNSGTGTPTNGIGTGGSPLSFINPQDIESIDVLKDADATSIYGSRAANGAIIITTKKGKIGKTAVNFNIQQGGGKIASKMKMMNTEQYLVMRKEAFANDNIAIPTNPDEFNPANYDLTTYDQKRYTDWQKVLIGGTAQYTNILATLSGGNNNTQYLFSTGYQREGTVTPGDLHDQKASVHFNFSSTSENKKLKFSFSGNYVGDNNKLAQVTLLANSAFILPPNAPKLYNNDGTLNWQYIPNTTTFTFTNPLASLNKAYINKTTNLVSNAIISYQIIPGLDIKSSFGYNRLQSEEINTTPKSVVAPLSAPFLTRRANFNTAKITSWIIEPQITYVKNIWEGKLDVLVGSTIQRDDRDRQQLNATGFSSDASLFNIKAASSVVVDGAANAVILSTYKYNALFGRINYNIKDKYLFTISARRDGSSRFGKENRFHNFGSVAGAWIFSNENLIRENIEFLSFGKIRASYGTTGSDQIGDYTYLNLYQNTSTLGTNYQGIIGLEPFRDFPNPYLQWESTKKISASLDLGFFKDKILLSGTYYRNRSSNQIQNFGLIAVTGGTGVNTNLPATIQNKGWEITANAININNKYFRWSTSVNITIPRNKLLKADKNYFDENVIGRPLGVVPVYHFTGVDPTTGYYTVADKSGKLTSTPDASLDKTIYIDLNPKFYGGFQNSVSYKGLTFDFLFQFVNQKGANGIFGNANVPGSAPINQRTNVLNRWQQPGDHADIQKYTTINGGPTYDIARSSDKYYSDASYIRLKNTTLSYQLPYELINKVHIQNARVYMQGQNLITITKYLGGDPENRTISGLPPLKILTFGIQVTL